MRPKTRPKIPDKSGPSRDQVEILCNCMKPKTIKEIMGLTGRTNRTKFRDQVLKPLLEEGFVEMTIPDKPTSRLQKYRLTGEGLALLKGLGEVGNGS